MEEPIALRDWLIQHLTQMDEEDARRGGESWFTANELSEEFERPDAVVRRALKEAFDIGMVMRRIRVIPGSRRSPYEYRIRTILL